jgi:hypothetical protein
MFMKKMLCNDLPFIEPYRHIHHPKGMFCKLAPLEFLFLLWLLLKFFRSPYPTKGPISNWVVFKTRELDLHMKSKNSKQDLNYHLPIHTHLWSKKYLTLWNVVDDYPLTLQECICSLEPYIGHHVPNHLLSIVFKDTFDVHLVIRIHTKAFCQ